MSTSVVIMDLVNLFHVREFSIQGVGGRVLNFIEETKQLWGSGHGFSMIGSFGVFSVALVFTLGHPWPNPGRRLEPLSMVRTFATASSDVFR